jgi:ABC-type glycerol-3-phosphate transport system substrate-binding protein
MFDVMMRYAPEQKFGQDWDAFPVPYSPDVPEGKLACHVSPYPLVLCSASKHPTEAFKVMAWMQNLERTIKAGAYMANVPQTKSALEEALKRKAGSPGWDVAVKFALTSPNQHAFPVTPISAEYSDRFQQELGLVTHGQKTAEEAMTALKGELQQSLEKALKTT